MREGLRLSTLLRRRKEKLEAGPLAVQGNEREFAAGFDKVTDMGLGLSGKESPGVIREELVNFDGGMNKSDVRSDESECGGGDDMEAENKHKGNGVQGVECNGDNGDEKMMEKEEWVEVQTGVVGESVAAHCPLLNEFYKEGGSGLGNPGKNSDNGNNCKEAKDVANSEFNAIVNGKEEASGSMEHSEYNEDCGAWEEKVQGEDLDRIKDHNKVLKQRLVIVSANDIEDDCCSKLPPSLEDEGGKSNQLLDGLMDCDAEIVVQESEPNALRVCKEKANSLETSESRLVYSEQRTHVKEEVKAQMVCKVLRSRVVAVNGSGKVGGAGQTRVGKRKSDTENSDKVAIKSQKDESGQPTGVSKMKHNGRRGRPPKVKVEKAVAVPPFVLLGKKNKRRGRPPKVEIEEDVTLVEMFGGKKVSQAERKVEVPASASLLKMNCLDFHSNGSKKVCTNQLSKVKKNSETNKLKSSNALIKAIDESSGLRMEKKVQNLESEGKATKNKRMGKPGSRREEKNSVRQRIVNMLLIAGWKIEYRPRQDGREYSDAVYVSPEGKACWSVTLAYKVLKKSVEDGHVGSETGSSFCFNPLPEEELQMLFRVAVNKRSGKNKKNGNQDDMPNENALGVISNEKTIKHQCSSRGRKKRNRSPGEKGNSVNHSKRKPISVWDGTQNRRQCALLVRSSSQGLNSANHSFVAHSRKHSILSWMIDSGSVPLGGKVVYCTGTQAVLEGHITRDGINCECCGKIFSLTEFESHSGSKLCQPYENMYLENGSSLFQSLLDSWNKQEELCHSGFYSVNVDNDDPNDDICGICGDGGDLICCDGCPSTFHQGCLKIESFPLGKWFCVYCSCKYCETFSGDICDEIQDQCGSSLLACRFCEEKYHSTCIFKQDVTYVQSKGPTFCGRSCEQVFEQLQRLVGVKCDLGDGFTWTLIQHSDVKSNAFVSLPWEMENNSKLAVAQSIMHECFLPIVDSRSNINLIHNVLYSCGSNFMRLNFSCFFTAVLERGDEVISAASIRIHGRNLAEMPFIATCNNYRRQGMCRRLLGALESKLSFLDVERLVIPALPEVKDMWISVFGFQSVTDTSRLSMQHINMLVFPGTVMLEKQLRRQFTEGDTNTISGNNV